MAGNTRGKLKEHFEGVHRNFDWSIKHLQISASLIKEHNPSLQKAIRALHKGICILDALSQDIYSKL